MSQQSASTAVSVSSPQRAHRVQVLAAYLEACRQSKTPLPVGKDGKPACRVVLKRLGLSPDSVQRWPEMRAMIQACADEVGLVPTGAVETVTGPAVPQLVSLTYHQLLDQFEQLAVRENSLAQYRSALTRFARMVGKSVDDVIGEELGQQFDDRVRQFRNNYYAGSAINARSQVSCLARWQELYNARRRSTDLPSTMAGAVRILCRQDARSRSELVAALKAHAVPDILTHPPRTWTREAVTALEAVFDVVAGTLASRATWRNPRCSKHYCPVERFPAQLQGQDNVSQRRRSVIRKLLPDDFTQYAPVEQDKLLTDACQRVAHRDYLTPYGRTMWQNQQLPYRLAWSDFPDRLKEECERYTRMKLSKGTPGRTRKGRRWCEETADFWLQEMRAFFGCLLLPADHVDDRLRGCGLQLSDLTLGLLVLPEMVAAFVALREARTGGRSSGIVRQNLTSYISMLSPTDGWLPYTPELCSRLSAEAQERVGQAGGWAAQCQLQLDHLKEERTCRTYITSRDPFGPVAPLLDTGRPLEAINSALRRHRAELADMESQTDCSMQVKALAWRDFLIVSSLSRLPLRTKQWRTMAYMVTVQSFTNAAQASNLRLIDGQNWALHLPASEFKNCRNKDVFGPNVDRDVKLTLKESQAFRSLLADLDHYMRLYRPVLCCGDGPVFPALNGTTLDYQAFHRLVAMWSTRYVSELGDYHYGLRIPGVKSFGPHVFRHLVACHLVMTTASYEAAANVLLDSIETVRQHYGFCMPDLRLRSALDQIDVWHNGRAEDRT
jgi:hypothetical protein